MRCIYCKSTAVYVVQVRQTQTGQKNIFRCTDCKRRHTPNQGFSRFRHEPRVIALAIGMRSQGISLEKITKMLSQFEVAVSRKTILDWEKKFANKRDLINKHQQPYTGVIER